jgi:hypothetical protein
VQRLPQERHALGGGRSGGVCAGERVQHHEGGTVILLKRWSTKPFKSWAGSGRVSGSPASKPRERHLRSLPDGPLSPSSTLSGSSIRPMPPATGGFPLEHRPARPRGCRARQRQHPDRRRGPGAARPNDRHRRIPRETRVCGRHPRGSHERLFLSHRTIGSHLYRAFPKLGVKSRAELAVVLRQVHA